MLSIDGTPDFLVDHFLATGVLPANGAFARMKKEGAYAKTVFPINVASTGPSHISIFTGAEPGASGIVGNSFRNRSQKWDAPALTAFKQSYSTENIFRAAMRQGKKVIALGGVGIDYADSNRMTDKMLMYPYISGPSSITTLSINKEKYPVLNGQYTRLVTNSAGNPEISLGADKKAGLWTYLRDTLVQEAGKLKPSFEIIIDTDSSLNNGYAVAVPEIGWQVLRIEANGKQYTLSATLFNASPATGQYKLYLSPAAEVYGYPQSFMNRMQEACGLWPGEPDNLKQTAGLVSEATWFEQVGRLAAYSQKLILQAMKEEDWDLLFGYFSTLDDVQHRYTLTDKNQLDYSAENGKRPARYQKILAHWFRVVDNYLLEIMNAAPAGTSFVIFSDHGMLPVHSVVLLHNYLETQGFSFSKKEIQAQTSGNSAHIYINPEKINSALYPGYMARLKACLQNFRDSQTGAPIFELVADSIGQKKIGLYNALYSGDLFVSCRSGYSLSGKFLPSVPYLVKNSFDPDMFKNEESDTRNFLIGGTMNETGRAVHGGLGKIRKGQSIFYAWGAGVPARKLKEVSALQIAPTIASLLKINPPAQAMAKPLF